MDFECIEYIKIADRNQLEALRQQKGWLWTQSINQVKSTLTCMESTMYMKVYITVTQNTYGTNNGLDAVWRQYMLQSKYLSWSLSHT